MTPERRISTPDRRERVHGLAQYLTTRADHDYDRAVAFAEGHVLYNRRSRNAKAVALWSDVLTLLRRRAATVAA